MNEKKAKELYELKYNKVTSLGLLIRPEIPWLGYSADGVVWPYYLIEIKYPIQGKNMAALAAVKTMKWFNLDCNGNIISFRDTHKYLNQIQLVMYLLNVK